MIISLSARLRKPAVFGLSGISLFLPAFATGSLFLVNAGPASAQDVSPSPTYSLSQTIGAALASSAEIQTATRDVQIARKQADVEFARLRPNIRLDGTATKYDDKSRVSIAGSPSIVVADDHAEILTAGATLDLDLFGQIRAAASQAKLQSLADQFTLSTLHNRRILTAKSIYYNLLRAEHQVLVAEAALATAREQQTTALKLNLGQVGQKIDVLRANTQVARAEQDLLIARNSRDIVRQDFNDLVGQPLSAPVHVQDVPGVTVGVDVGMGAAVGVPTPQSASPYSVPASEIAGIDITRSIDAAQRQRPEALTAQVLVRVAEAGIKLAHAGLEPTFALSTSANYFPSTSFQYPRQAESEVTIGISIPLYDGGATRARVEAARLQIENARTILDRRRKDIALDVRETYLNLIKTARQIEATNTALKQAIAARQLAQMRYEGQVGLYLEITDAQSALVQAENSQVNAVYDYLVARAQFENALGAPSTK